MKPNLCFFMIVFNDDYILPEVLETALEFGPVVAVEGPVKYWQGCGYTTSADQTNAILNRYKVPTLHGQWPEKDEMVKAGEALIPPDTTHVWEIDADEIYFTNHMRQIVNLLADQEYDAVAFHAMSFYGGFERVMTGFEARFEMMRIQRWYPGAHWYTHRPPTVLAPDGRPWRAHKFLSPDELDRMGINVFHYSYVWPRQMQRKANYYHDYDPKGTIPYYYQRIYQPWVQGGEREKKAVEDAFNGVHNWTPERRGPCRTAPFRDRHPPQITQALPRLKALFDLEAAECFR